MEQGGEEAIKATAGNLFPSSTFSMNEEHIRKKLRKVLARAFAPEPIAIISEFGLDHGNCRADVAVISSRNLYGFEIKSEEDNLKRLPRQIRFYSNVLDYASVVVAPKHLEEVTALLPKWWGIYVAEDKFRDGRIRIRPRRLPERNPQINFYMLVAMMWKGDAVEFLEKKGEGKSWRRKARWHLWKRIEEISSVDEVREFMREKFIARIAMGPGWKCKTKKRKKRRRGRRRRGRWRKRGRGKYQPY